MSSRAPLPFLLLCLGGLAAPAAAEDVSPDLGACFPGFRSTLVLRDVAGGRTVRHGAALARSRTAPCSTFKVPNSIIGLETGVIPDASFVLPWDGVSRALPEWNRDHDLRSAMHPGAADPHGWWVGSVEEQGRLYVFAALIEGPGATGRVCRPMAEKALAALGVLPPR